MNSTTKGKVVELITAGMHEVPNAKVQTNVFLPSKKDGRRKREIDVLLTSEIAGYSIQFAIECKNEKSPIGTVKIDQFIAKLEDVGIPVQHGIYVSASGYKKTGLGRALDAGLKPLTLRGLTQDGFRAIVADAFQAIVFLLANITEIAVIDNDESSGAESMPFFVDSRDNHQGWIPDLIWQDWVSGKVPSSLGDHEVALTVPKEWRARRDGRLLEVTSITAKVRVHGLGITIPGRTEQYSLLDASTITIEKATVNASFDAPSGKYVLAIFQTEEELEAFLNRPATVKVVQRMRLPRIKSGPIFWPPSERVHSILLARFRSFVAGNASWDPTLADFEGIEGSDLQAVFEPIWENHPLIRRWKDGKGGGVEE